MSLSCCRYLVDKLDGIVRMKGKMFERLLRDPFHHSVPDLAGQCARVAKFIVELRDRVPVQVFRRLYFVLPFDEQGRVGIERIRKQQYALAASVIDPVLAPPERSRGSARGRRPLHQARRQAPSDGSARPID